MKHIKLFEQFINEKKDEKYIAYVDDKRKPGGSDKEIKNDYNLDVKDRTSSGFSIIGAKEDIEAFIDDYNIILDDEIQVYETKVNESVQVEKTQHGDASIGWKGKEIVFSSDKETIGAVAKALINLQQERTSLGTKVTKGINWMSIDSAQGDVYMERKPGSSTIMLKQSEEFSRNAVEFDIPASEVNNIVKKLQALHYKEHFKL